jgi:hypothetical protein
MDTLTAEGLRLACGRTAATSAMTSTRRSRRLLGFSSPAIAVLAVTGVALFTFIPGAVATDPDESLASVLADAALMAVAAALVLLTTTARVVGTDEGLQIINLFHVTTVDAGEVAAIEVHRGLVIVTTDGPSLTSFANGASLVGDLLGYPRSRVARRRCEGWLAAMASQGTGAVDGVARRLRPAVWLLPATLLAVYVVEVLIVRAAS